MVLHHRNLENQRRWFGRTSRYDISSFNTPGDEHARAHTRTLPVVTPLNKGALWEKRAHARLISHGPKSEREVGVIFQNTHASRRVHARIHTSLLYHIISISTSSKSCIEMCLRSG